MAMRFHVHGGAAPPRLALMTTEGDVVAVGEPHSDMAEVHAEIRKVQRAPANHYAFVRWRDAAGQWYWLLRQNRGSHASAHGDP